MQKLLFLPIALQHVGIWSTKTPYSDVRTALQAETVYGQGKWILCTLDGTGKTMAIESRNVNYRRPLDGGHRDGKTVVDGIVLDHKR